MQKKEYYNIFSNEETHFYYTSVHKTIDALIKEYSKKKNPKILDAGCGTGGLLIKLQSIGKIYGIDNSEHAIKLAKKRGLKNIKKGSVLKIPFRPNTFDIVTCIDVLYHEQVTNDSEAIKEIFRVMKVGGVLILKLPAHNWLRGTHDKVVHTRHRYNLKEVKNLLMTGGFQIKKLSYSYLFLFPLVVLKRFLDQILKLGVSSEIGRLPSNLNLILEKIMNAERKIFLKQDLPTGLFIYAVAIKPNMGKHKKSLMS